MNLQLITASLFHGHLTALQTDSINTILGECVSQHLTDPRQIAYILATAYHECYDPKHPETRLTPMREFGGEAYLKSKKYWPYYGRGFSQLTWRINYLKEGKRLGLDLLNNPGLMLQLDTAANSHVYCMAHGVYTGKKLSDYINTDRLDFINARRIVNGTDRADIIGGYAGLFLEGLV